MGSAIRDGGSHGLRGVPIDTDELAGSERFKKHISRNQKQGHLATAQKVPGVDLPDMGDGDGVESSVAAGGAESVISLCIPW